MNELSDDEIEKIIGMYKKKRDYDNQKYQEKKDDPEFIKKNRERARKYYENNKKKKYEAYKLDKEYYSARSTYNYYKKSDRLSLFKDKHKEKYDLLVERKFILD